MPDDQDIESLLDKAKTKPIAGSAITISGIGRRHLLDSYDDVVRAYDDASGADLLHFTSYVDFPHVEERVLAQISVAVGAILAIEEWNDELSEMARQDQERCQELQAQTMAGAPLPPGFSIIGMPLRPEER